MIKKWVLVSALLFAPCALADNTALVCYKASGISNCVPVTALTPLPVLPTGSAPSPSPAAGITPGIAGSAAPSDVVKAAGGNLYGAYVSTGATQGWLMVFNSTTAPSNGSTTAGVAAGNLQECVYAPANSTTSINYIGAPPEVFTTGITLAFSSTGCGTLTLSATAYLHGSAS